MAELGPTIYHGTNTDYISRADGYAPPDGSGGVSYELDFFNQISDDGNTYSTELFDRTQFTLPEPPPGTIIYYVMRGRDIDCVPVTYRTWTVINTPDTTGVQYSGPKCGSNPLTDIVVTYSYTR